MIEIDAPDGSVVEFPDGTADDVITSVMASEYGGPKAERTWSEWSKTAPGAAVEGIKQGATFGFGDEAQAGIAALASAPFTDKLTLPQAYNQALDEFRVERDQARADHPALSIAGELAGGVATGTQAINALRGANAARTTAGPLAAAGRGIRDGVVSGAVYGFGTGEGSTANRLANSVAVGAAGGAIGGALGGASGVVSNSLARRAARLLEAKRSRQAKIPPDMTGGSAVAPDAVSKVIERLRADYPDEAQFQDAIKRFQSGEATLAELGGERTKDLALGAAQYPTGKAVTNEFFYGKEPGPGQAAMGGAIQSARQNVTDSLENISGNKDYLGTLDEIVQKGRANASEFYKRAYEKTVPVDYQTLNIPEVKAAIQKARQQYPSELRGQTDYSVKTIDYAKRVLDDEIQSAIRSGQGNFARSRTEIKKQLLSEVDEMVPFYKKAREVSGDYLSHKEAMEAGKSFKGNSKQIARDFKKLSDTEKEAYLSGVKENVNQIVDKVRDNGNAHTKVFGTPETRAKLKAVLPEKEFKQLENDLWASDRIYRLKDKILGNSTTASKTISAEEFASDPIMQNFALGQWHRVPLQAANLWVKKHTSGLSDKTAGDVAKILTAKSDSERLRLIRQIQDQRNPKEATKQTGDVTLKTYYQIVDMIKPYRNSPGIIGGNLASQPLRPDGPPPKVDLPELNTAP